MGWIYREFFYVPKYDKVRNRVMNAYVVLTVAVILVSLIAMSLSAYAYFTSNVSSGTNQIQAAHFDAAVSVTDTDGWPITLTDGENGSKYVLLEAGIYQVDIAPGGTAKTGFCILTASGCETVYHTQQLDAVDSLRRSVSFFLKLPGTSVVTFTPNWGTSSYYADYTGSGANPEQYILAGENVMLSLTEKQGSADTQPEDSEPAVTQPPTTDSPATEPEGTDSSSTNPPATEAEPTDPSATDYLATEPGKTDSPATAPAATMPETTQPSTTDTQ